MNAMLLTGGDGVTAGRWKEGRDPYLVGTGAPGLLAETFGSAQSNASRPPSARAASRSPSPINITQPARPRSNDVLVSARRICQAAGFRLVDETPHHSFGHDLVGQTWTLGAPLTLAEIAAFARLGAQAFEAASRPNRPIEAVFVLI